MPGRGSACGPRLFMRYAQPPNVINNSPSARKRTYKMKSEISTLSELDRVFHSRKQTIMRKAVELEEATGSTVGCAIFPFDWIRVKVQSSEFYAFLCTKV